MSLEQPRFRKINESFTCAQCGFHVPQARATCRDHCPQCLWSLHVDENPGDRSSGCQGKLKPVGYEYQSGKGYMILYECQVCFAKKRNKFLEQDSFFPDSLDALLALTPIQKDHL